MNDERVEVNGQCHSRPARFVRLMEELGCAMHREPGRRRPDSARRLASGDSGVVNTSVQRAQVPASSARQDRNHAHVVLDDGGRYLAANDQALLDLAIEITGCLHDADRLKRPHTDELTLTDLDAGVTALYDAVAHLRCERGGHVDVAADIPRHFAHQIHATGSNWRPRLRSLPRAIDIMGVVLPTARAALHHYRAGFRPKSIPASEADN